MTAHIISRMTEPCENIELCQIEMAEEYNHSCRYIIFDEEGRPAPDSAGRDYLGANSEDVDNTFLNGSGSSNAVFNVSTAGINRGYLTPEVMDDCHKQKMTLIQSSDLSAIKNATGHQATEMWQILNARRYYWLGDKDSSEKDGRKCKFAIFEIRGSGIYTKHEATAKNWNCNKISKDFLGFCKANCIMKK